MADDDASTTTAAPPPPRPCNRCKDKPAVYDLRSAERVCPACFAAFVANKNIKRLEVMQRETRAPAYRPGAGAASGRGPPPPQRYLLALSGGPASAALLQLLSENLAQQRRGARGGGAQRPKFELVVAHVDTENFGPAAAEDEGEGEDDGDDDALLAPFRARFPDLPFVRVPLADALALRTVDWDGLFPGAAAAAATTTPEAGDEPLSASASSAPAANRLARLFAHGLASPSSRADVRRLLVRHLLLATAARARCDAVLLGCSATALAERTLAETAKGRGFALPWLVNDGAAPVPASLAAAAAAPSLFPEEEEEKKGEEAGTAAPKQQPPPPPTIPVYSPLRDLLRAEIATYHATLDPPLTGVFFGADHLDAPHSAPTPAAVVSHKDLSIDDVMRRYFADVERAYPSVVANVVRTTGKLERYHHDHDDDHGGEAHAVCGLCGVGRDEAGDARWRGELGEPAAGIPPGPPGTGEPQHGEATVPPARRLCYGCERSVYG